MGVAKYWGFATRASRYEVYGIGTLLFVLEARGNLGFCRLFYISVFVPFIPCVQGKAEEYPVPARLGIIAERRCSKTQVDEVDGHSFRLDQSYSVRSHRHNVAPLSSVNPKPHASLPRSNVTSLYCSMSHLLRPACLSMHQVALRVLPAYRMITLSQQSSYFPVPSPHSGR